MGSGFRGDALYLEWISGIDDECPQLSYTRDQKVRAQSSAEPEFCGGSSVLIEDIGLAGIYSEMDFSSPVVLRLDSTGALGMFKRRGTGMVRHTDLKFLVAQDFLADGRLSAIEEVNTLVHRPDLCTKVHPQKRLMELLNSGHTYLKRRERDEDAEMKVVHTTTRSATITSAQPAMSLMAAALAYFAKGVNGSGVQEYKYQVKEFNTYETFDYRNIGMLFASYS